jgi:hypothetical protein
MTATAARIGYGTSFAIESAVGSGTYVALAEVYQVSPPSSAVEQVDATHFASPDRAREFIPAFIDYGQATAEMNYVPNSTTDQRLSALEANGEKLSMRITYPNGATVTFQGSVESYEKAIPNGDKMTATATIKVSSKPVMASAVAPVNVLLPSISGTAQDGQTLTAIEGIWNGAPTFTYQWQEDDSGWANISGATSKTYVVQTAVVGNPLRVIVTGTNAHSAVSATSAATADVIAA